MDKLLTVMRREFLSRIKTKGFIIGTILTPVFLIAMMVVPGLLLFLKSDKPKQIAVIDQTGAILDSLTANLSEKNKEGERLYNFIKHETSSGKIEEEKKALAEQVDRGDLDGYIVIPTSIYEEGNADFYGKSVTNFRDNSRIENAISRAVTARRIQQSGLDSKQVRRLVRRVDLKTFRIAEGGKEEEDQGRTKTVVWILVAFIYMAMLVYGQMVMRSVIEEKSSRVIEAVISSVKPFHLMAGKIFGIGALGLAQYSLWALVMGLLSRFGVKIMGLSSSKLTNASNFAMPSLAPETLVFFIVFFVLGYLLFATMYAALGAMVNSDQEAQQLVFPLVMLVIIPFLCTFYIIGSPNSQLSVILSLVPFFAPITMFARIAVQTPPFWQIALCLVLMVATIFGMIWIVGRIYRVGVLMYGKRPTLPEVIKWIKYA
jgi:ABC-2 type transport system permease protein